MAVDPTSIVDFAKVAPYLTNPLVLVGFVLLLFFGVHEALIKSRILPPVSQTASGKVVPLVLRYGFIVAVLLILLGFSLAAWNSYLKTKAPVEVRTTKQQVTQQAGDCSANANGDNNSQNINCDDKAKK
jgi:hypothetical protein